MPSPTDIARLHPMAAAIWLGMLIGVSFIATPVKFQAAGLDLATALDVGRLTFGAFSRVEWVLAIGLAVTVCAARPSRWRQLVTATVNAGLALQAIWLLPALTARVETIMSGTMPDASFHHVLYAGIEVAKALGLLVLALPAREPGHEKTPARSDRDWQSNAM